MNPVGDTANWITAFAAVATAVVAVWALFVASSQLKENSKASAISAYANYLRLAVENPKLASADASSADPQYYWFVSNMLFACEEILFYAPTDPEWLMTVDAQIDRHRKFLSSDDFKRGVSLVDRLGYYSPELRARVLLVLDERKA